MRKRQATFCVVKSQPGCFQLNIQGNKQQRHIFFIPPRILCCCTLNELLITPEGTSFGGNICIFLSLVGFICYLFHNRVVRKARICHRRLSSNLQRLLCSFVLLEYNLTLQSTFEEDICTFDRIHLVCVCCVCACV